MKKRRKKNYQSEEKEEKGEEKLMKGRNYKDSKDLQFYGTFI